MKCGVIFQTVAKFKVFMPVFKEFEKRGINAIIFFRYPQNNNYKTVLEQVQTTCKNYSFLKNVEICHVEDLKAEYFAVIEKKLDFMIIIENVDNYKEDINLGSVLKKAGILLFSLQGTFTFQEEGCQPKYMIKYLDQYFCAGKGMIDWYINYWKEKGLLSSKEEKKIRDIFIVTGVPILENIGISTRNEILERYNLPKDRKIVLFMAPHLHGLRRYNDSYYNNIFIYENLFYSFYKILKTRSFNLLNKLFSRYRYSDMLRSIKNFCTENNAFLVIKVRDKDIIKSLLRNILYPHEKLNYRYGDLVLTDEIFYPYTSIDLLSISDLVIHVKSSAILEILAVGVPNICIMLPFLDKVIENQKEFYQDELTTKINFQELPKKLKNSNLSNFVYNKEKRDVFLKEFLNRNNVHSSKMIVDHILKYIS